MALTWLMVSKSYMDSINWYWDRRVDAFAGNISKVSEDSLCKLTIKDNPNLSCWNVFAFENRNKRLG